MAGRKRSYSETMALHLGQLDEERSQTAGPLESPSADGAIAGTQSAPLAQQEAANNSDLSDASTDEVELLPEQPASPGDPDQHVSLPKRHLLELLALGERQRRQQQVHHVLSLQSQASLQLWVERLLGRQLASFKRQQSILTRAFCGRIVHIQDLLNSQLDKLNRQHEQLLQAQQDEIDALVQRQQEEEQAELQMSSPDWLQLSSPEWLQQDSPADQSPE